MDLTKELLDNLDCPLWIKNKENKIVYINNSFKSTFNIDVEFDLKYKYENLNNIIESKNQELLKIVKILKGKTNKLSKINNKIYKNIVFSYKSERTDMAGIFIDVTDIYEINNTRYEKDILKTVIDNIPELIFYKDKDLIYKGINKECEKFYKERGVYSVIGKTDIELPLDKEFVETCEKHDRLVLDTKKPLYIEESAIIPGTDDYETFETIKTPIINEDGSIWGLVGVVRDISEQKRVEKKLRFLSYSDTLTGLYNRAYFDEKLDELIKDNQFPIGIIIGDINGLKIVNDTLGHIEGDKLLTSMSKVLKDACNEKGFVFRWGGDEFVTVLPNSNEIECAEYMEKVSKLCEEENSENFKLSIAQGYSLINKDTSIDESLRESEDKVYRQKILDKKSVRTSILHTLRENLQSKNVETEEHTARVEKHCLEVGKYLELDDETMDKLMLVGKLHDIGKTGIPEHILLKPNKLTDDEYEIMKTHAEKGYRLALLLPEISHISRGILTHHERWDGKGYPLGIAGEEIPLIARIVSVVDAFDAMTNDRVYSRGIGFKEAVLELKKCAGKQFDPNIVDIFCNIIESKK